MTDNNSAEEKMGSAVLLESLMYALGTAACNCPPCSARREKVGEWLTGHDRAVRADERTRIATELDGLAGALLDEYPMNTVGHVVGARLDYLAGAVLAGRPDRTDATGDREETSASSDESATAPASPLCACGHPQLIHSNDADGCLSGRDDWFCRCSRFRESADVPPVGAVLDPVEPGGQQ